MIKKLTFKGAKTYEECQDKLFSKIDEIIEVVNSLTNANNEIEMPEGLLNITGVITDIKCIKASIGVLEATTTHINRISDCNMKTNIAELKCGGVNIDRNGKFDSNSKFWTDK